MRAHKITNVFGLARPQPLDHPWRRYDAALAIKPRPSRTTCGINWVTGEPIVNKLESWLMSAVKRNCGVVLDREKTLEMAQRLGLVSTALVRPIRKRHRGRGGRGGIRQFQPSLLSPILNGSEIPEPTSSNQNGESNDDVV